MKETVKNFLEKYDKILYGAGFVILLILLVATYFTPKMGKYVMVDEIVGCVLCLGFAIYLIYQCVISIVKKTFMLGTIKDKLWRVVACVAGIALFVFAIFSSVNIVSDLSNGTEVIKLTDIEFYETKRVKSFKTKYTIEGINSETGKFGTYEISYEACEQYVGEDSVFLEYYPKTQRVVDCFK